METISVNIAEEVLKEFGLSYESLTKAEQQTFDSKYFDLKRLTVSDVKTYVSRMKNSVAMQLCDTPEDDPANPLLKARLKNYILFELFLVTPDKAEEALRKQMKTQKRRKRIA